MDLIEFFLVLSCLFATCEVDAARRLRHTTVTRSDVTIANTVVPILFNLSDAQPDTDGAKQGRVKVSDQELQTFLSTLFRNDDSAPSRLGYNITANAHEPTALKNSGGLSSSKQKHAIREALQNSSRVFDDADFAALERLKQWPTYRSFYSLLDNYEPQLGRAEVVTRDEVVEMNEFLTDIFNTRLANLTFQFLLDKKKFTTMQQFKAFVNTTWFSGFQRGGSRSTLDSSAFEHVFAGEHNSDKLTSGFHNWIRLLVEERTGNFQYCGWHETTPYALSFAFIWRGNPKFKTSVLLDTSPELEIFAYTTCFIFRPDSSCPIYPDPFHRILIKTDYLNQRDKKLSSAYPIITAKKRKRRLSH